MKDINGIEVMSSVDTVEKPSINDWMNEFNVSTRYEVKRIPLPDGDTFCMKRFKQNIDKGLILAEETVS
jgi:hypothetical protein